MNATHHDQVNPPANQSHPAHAYRPGVGMMLHSGAHVFVGRRIGLTHAAWQMPQGGIDPGETPYEAMLRELLEETSIPAQDVVLEASSPWLCYDVPVSFRPISWGGRYVGQRQCWFLLRYEGDERHINLHASPHPEFEEWKWQGLDALVSETIEFKHALYQQLLEKFYAWLR